MYEPMMWRRPTIIHIPEEIMRKRTTMPELEVPDDYEPPPSAAPNVTPNPNEDPHRALKKAIRLIEASRDKLNAEYAEQKSIKTGDPGVQMLLDLAQASGLVEGYMWGEQWKEKYYGER